MNDDAVAPDIGRHVKCLLTNNTLVEGTVMIWDLSRWVKLRSLDSESVFIIHHPDRDIVMTKIVLNSEPEEEFPVYTPDPKPLPELEAEWQKTYDGPSDDELRTKRLAELKVLMIEQEKKIIRDKVKTHESSSAYSPQLPKYQLPFMKKVGVPRSPYQPGKLPRK